MIGSFPNSIFAALLIALTAVISCPAQQLTPDLPEPNDAQVTSLSQTPAEASSAQQTGTSKPDAPQPKINADDSGQQTKRILWIIPNFRAVSAETHLPPLSTKDNFWLATQDSFDYSSFLYTGLIAGGAMAAKSEPSFGQGASGYGNYFAHGFADGTIENYMVEAIVPSLVKEDPRYYTLGRGGFFKRSGYALSRLFITRTDSGNPSPNISEIVGAGAAAGIGNAYYPADTNVWVKTYQRWIGQILQDAAGNLAKEFWPDINRAIFHNKY